MMKSVKVRDKWKNVRNKKTRARNLLANGISNKTSEDSYKAQTELASRIDHLAIAQSQSYFSMLNALNSTIHHLAKAFCIILDFMHYANGRLDQHLLKPLKLLTQQHH